MSFSTQESMKVTFTWSALGAGSVIMVPAIVATSRLVYASSRTKLQSSIWVGGGKSTYWLHLAYIT